MRKLIYGINLSLDGCCDHAKLLADEEVHTYFADLLRDADILLYGRITYQLMVPYWPDVAKSNSGDTRAINDFAHAFAGVSQIVVVSRTLDKAEGKNTRIIRANLREEILKLKQEQGKNIMVGGVDIPEQLMQMGLIDEYHFVIQPLIVGESKRLSENMNLSERLSLKLADTKILKSGCVALRYLKN